MPRRDIVFAESEVYHVFNRGVMKLPTYQTPSDYKRFLDLVTYYRFNNTPKSYSKFRKLSVELRDQVLQELTEKNALSVEILSYCLMPNHFHMILRQANENGIRTFMSNVLNGYTKYINIKKDRVGPLWQSMFQAVRIENDEQFVHTCRYVHLNPSTAYLIRVNNLAHYAWSSYPAFLGRSLSNILNEKELLGFYKDAQALEQFTLDQADYQRTLAKIKHIAIDFP